MRRYGPPGSADFFRRILPQSIGLIEAWLPNFGDCLLLAIREILARGHGGAVVLNSDSPTLPTALLVETAEVLARPGDRAVLGPSTRRRLLPAWAQAARTAACSKTSPGAPSGSRSRRLTRAREIGLDVHMLPAWYDVDDIDAPAHAARGNSRLRGESSPQNLACATSCPAHRGADRSRFAGSRDLAGDLARARSKAEPEIRADAQCCSSFQWMQLVMEPLAPKRRSTRAAISKA